MIPPMKICHLSGVLELGGCVRIPGVGGQVLVLLNLPHLGRVEAAPGVHSQRRPTTQRGQVILTPRVCIHIRFSTLKKPDL
jgi:hypothetical protein